MLPDRQSIATGGGRRHVIHSVLDVGHPMKYGDFVWNEHGVSAGQHWILVDLESQTMSVFRGPDEIGTAITLYGVDDKPTPTGRFAVLDKRKNHRSSLYDAPMPFTLRLTSDGVSIHGSNVVEGMGSHGCLGVPTEFAKRLFRVMPVGGEVVILRDVADHILPSARRPSAATVHAG